MIWRILIKDWKLLWPVALGVGAINVFLRLILIRIGLFPEFRVGSLVNLLSVAGLFGTMIIIVLAVQQDSLPGVRQDWLVRPIKRRDLFLAKALFMVLMVQAPIFAAEVIQGLAAGFPIGQSVGAPLSNSLWLVLMVDLPILAFATLTRNLMEAVFAGLICFLVGAIPVGLLNVFSIRQPTMDTGIQWITDSTMALVAGVGAAAILAIQYSRRKTVSARCVFLGVGVVWLALLLTPWRPAFAIEQQLSPAPGAASAVAIEFQPGADSFQPPPGTELQDSFRTARGVATSRIYLPMRVGGVSADSMLLVDDAEVHLIAAQGRAIVARGGELEMRGRGKGGIAYQLVQIPTAWLLTNENRPVHIEVNYSLTLATLAAEHSIAAANGDLHTSDLGWCRSKINDADTAVQVRCMKPGIQPDSLGFTLLNTATGVSNPERIIYSPNYAPYFHAFQPDSMGRIGGVLPFRDPSGLARYPIDGSQLGSARIRIRSYSARDHIVRKLSAEGVHLQDWGDKAY